MSAESTDNTKRVKKCQIYKNVVPFLQNYVFCLADLEILHIFAPSIINFLNNDNYGRRFEEKE